MDASVIVVLLFGGLIILLLSFIVFGMISSHKKFITKALSIQEGMSYNQVFEILGSPTTEEKEDNKKIYTWEKAQWKGYFSGGTIVRSIKVIFIEDKVVSITKKHLDKSVYF